MKSRAARHGATRHGHVLPWLFWLAAAMLFGYGHLTRVAPGGMVDALMRDFAVGAAVLGNISAMYWYAYSIFQIPGGFLLDRFGPTRVLTGSVLLCAVGGILFAYAPNVDAANAGRFITGAGGAAIYACAIKIAHIWFDAKRFALLGGATILIGMFGATLGQAPVAVLIEIDGWRPVMFWVALAALPLGAFALLSHRSPPIERTSVNSSRQLFALMLQTVRSRRYWTITLYAAMIAGPSISFPVWGIAYYMQVLGYARAEAALFTTVALLGWAFGSLSAGWILGRIKRRKIAAIGCAAFSLLSWSLFVAFPGMPEIAHYIVMLVIGISAGGIVVGFILIADTSPPDAVGTATAITNTLVMLASAAILLIMGHVLDLLWAGEIIDGVRIYSPFAFRMAYLAMPAAALVALLAAFSIQEAPRGETKESYT
ncbi:MAG: MFS transporter [Rhodospirillaceae bacterium]|nr:MFS transporter [Rhodospirillaceae bacterium]